MLELGAGKCGLAGLGLAVGSSATEVVITDGNPEAVENLQVLCLVYTGNASPEISYFLGGGGGMNYGAPLISTSLIGQRVDEHRDKTVLKSGRDRYRFFKEMVFKQKNKCLCILYQWGTRMAYVEA